MKGFVTGVLVAACGVSPAHAVKCVTDVQQLRNALYKQYTEVRVLTAALNEKTFIEVLMSPRGETWSIINVGVDKSSCLLFSGKHMEPVGKMERKPGQGT